MSLFRTRLLPAGHGDCILVEYGPTTKPHRILIDGGTVGTWKHLKKAVEQLPEDSRKFELFVVTHIDADHIGGALGVLGEGVKGLEFNDIWFNGWRHLTGLEEQGPVQGEKLTTLLWPLFARWNKAFGGKAIVVPEQGTLPVVTLPGGMKLTLLSPTPEKLQALKPQWEKECAKAGLEPQKEPPEHPKGLELLGLVQTRRYLFSTNGSYFSHPDREAVARVVQRKVPGCELRFNYKNAYTQVWDSDSLRKKWGFTTSYPASDEAGDLLEL